MMVSATRFNSALYASRAEDAAGIYHEMTSELELETRLHGEYREPSSRCHVTYSLQALRNVTVTQ